MIEKVGSVSIFVSDQDRAKQFYTDVLGFELHTDEPLYPGAKSRWVAVAPKGAQTAVTLYLPDENVQEPEEQPWGTFVIIKDSEGNSLILSEPPKA